ncbi:hypothetical protein B0T17DRAFT_461601, partial [Bombardia bombarda]
IPDLTGQIVLVTGGTGGIGAEVVVELAKHKPDRILFTGRNTKSAEAVIQRGRAVAPAVNISFVPCDLASLGSVREAADKILSECPRLDLFLANAGVMAKPAVLSADGYETHFATNHVGHALLIRKLLPLLEKTADLAGADVRIIYTTSLAWRGGKIPFDSLKTTKDGPVMGRWFRYGNSKLANLLYARELARRHPKVLSLSIHPGVVGTGLVNDLRLFDRMFVKASQLGRILTPEQGAFNNLWSVSAPRASIAPGAFYEPVGRLSTTETAQSRDPELASKLWDWTEKELEKWM